MVSILDMDECNIFKQLSRQDYQQVLVLIRELILATDIAAHLRKVDQIAKMTEGGMRKVGAYQSNAGERCCPSSDGFDPSSDQHRYLFMCLLMTASDLSDQSKDFRYSKASTENIYKEFFAQGELEKQMGNEPIVMMDRERVSGEGFGKGKTHSIQACVPKIQIKFMDNPIRPTNIPFEEHSSATDSAG